MFAFKLTQRLKGAWFQPLNLQSESLVSKFGFKMGQLAPLRYGSDVWDEQKKKIDDVARRGLCTS
jgi:hypothetical protein